MKNLAAMCLDFHGVRPCKQGMQLEDELFEYVYDKLIQVACAYDGEFWVHSVSK